MLSCKNSGLGAYPVVVIFDLDGTLVDSAPGILASLEYAINKAGLSLPSPFDASLIGPPLPELLGLLFPEIDRLTVESIRSAFVDHYDSVGCFSSIPYQGISSLLSVLSAASVPLHIVTNKRTSVSLSIIHSLGWGDLFGGCLGSDHSGVTLPKSSNLSTLLTSPELAARQSIYLGDTYSDYQACASVSLEFAFASWGYEPTAMHQLPQSVHCLRAPVDLLENHLFRSLKLR